MRSRLVTLVLLGGLARADVTYPTGWDAVPALGPERGYAPPHVERRKLASGAELWVAPDHTLPLVTVRVVMPGAGAAADPAGKGGLADYTAALLFEAGAGELGGHALAERLESMGSQLASWAEVDAGFVEVSMLASHRKEVLPLLGAIVGAPRFDAADARRVHEDRKTAVILRRDEPGAVGHLILRAALEGAGSPYGHPMQGTLASLPAFGVDDARAFYRARWSPARMVVVAAGDVDPDELSVALDRAFEGFRAKGTPPAWPRPRAAPAATSRLLGVDRGDAEQANVVVGAIGLSRSEPRAVALEVATSLLGGTFSSRLSHRLREELGVTYGISAAAGYERATGTVSIESAIVTPKTGEGLAETLRIVTELGTTPVPPDELTAVQANLVRSLPQAFASNDAVVDAFADLAAGGLGPDWFDGYAGKIQAVTAADVQKVARAILDPSRLVVVVIGPLRTIGADLAKLGFGPAVELDADGARIKR